MKIIFLCGCLEPGRDGVGDYIRKLAGELIQQGHQITAIALIDPYYKEKITGFEYLEASGLQVLRLPSVWSAKKRSDRAKDWIKNFNPDWVSLQFVIYSFHAKGLPFGLGRFLLGLVKGRNTHIMFHELWIGFTTISPLKHKIVGFFQKKIILNIIKLVKPKAITTTNILYQLILKTNKVKADILPLFSNIPLANVDNSIGVDVLQSLSINESDRNNWFFTGTFGSLYPEADLEKGILQQLTIAHNLKRNLAFVGFGRISREGENEFERLKRIFADKVRFVHLGEQSPERISNIMRFLNTGISCTPKQHLGKSGVFSAMKLHELEVCMPSGEVIPEYNSEIDKYLESFIKRPRNTWDVAYISGCFYELLHKYLQA